MYRTEAHRNDPSFDLASSLAADVLPKGARGFVLGKMFVQSAGYKERKKKEGGGGALKRRWQAKGGTFFCSQTMSIFKHKNALPLHTLKF